MAKTNSNRKPTNNCRSNSSNGRKGNGKPKFQPKTQDKDQNLGKTNGDINDSSYYYGDQTVLAQVMNFSFNEFGGVPTEIHANNAYYDTTVGTYNNKMIAAYYLNPSMSTSGGMYGSKVASGIKTAGLRNFLLLSGSNAKTTNYAPQDVSILILGLAEVIKMSTFCARALGIAYLFNYRNRTYPETLLQAMGIEPTDFGQKLAYYRVRFNKLMALASKIPFPADIPLFRKASTLYSSIYMDDPSSALAQTYMFVPYSTWIFDEEYNEHGAGLRTRVLIGEGHTTEIFSIYLQILEDQINALLTSTSLNFIYSDVMRLAQNGKLASMITFSSIPEDFVVVPTYNEEAKIWIHNASIIGAPLHDPKSVFPDWDYTPDNDVSCDSTVNSVMYSPIFEHTSGYGYEMLLDFDHDKVTEEEKVMATRLSSRWITNDVNSKHYAVGLAVCDEYLVKINFYSGTNPDAADVGIVKSFYSTDTTQFSAVKITDALSKFDWAPIIYFEEANDKLYPIGDLDYYTLLAYDTLRRTYDYEVIHLLQIG